VLVFPLNVAVTALDATVTEEGTVRMELLLAKVTEAPPLGAGWVSITVHLVDALDPRLAGVQSIDETSTEDARFTVVLAELPL
jgi:hypothetical protein